MQITDHINPIVEAMTYFFQRVNGKRCRDQIERYASNIVNSDAIINELTPLCRLESILYEQLDVKDDRLTAFFTNYQGIYGGVYGKCLAAMVMGFDAEEKGLSSFEGSVDEYSQKLHALNNAQRIHSIAFEFSEFIEDVDCIEGSMDYLLKLLDIVPMSAQDKWSVLDCLNHFDEYVDELADLLGGAVKLIEANQSLYVPLLESLLKYFHSIPQQNAESHFEELYSIQIGQRKIERVCPLLFHMNSMVILYADDVSQAVTVFMGVCFREMLRLQKIRVNPVDISQAVKAISDPKRLEILRSMRDEPQYGQELSEKFGLTATTMHYHLNRLLTTGLVTCDVDGYRSYYRMDKKSVEMLIEKLNRYLLDR